MARVEAMKERRSTPAFTRGKKRAALEPGQRAALEWISAYLIDHPAEILETKSNLETKNMGSAKQQRKRKAEAVNFPPDKYKVVKQLPKYFLSQMLVDHGDFTVAETDCIDFASNFAIRFLCAFFFGLSDTSTIPKVLGGDKVLISAWFQALHVALGRRGVSWRVAGLIREDFTVDWTKGVYELEWDPAKKILARVTHRPTAVSTDVRDWNLKQDGDTFGGNHSDILAHFMKAKQELKLCDFFADGQIKASLSKEKLVQHAQNVKLSGRVDVKIQKTALTKSEDHFALARSRADDKRKTALSAKQRVPSKGMAAPLVCPEERDHVE